MNTPLLVAQRLRHIRRQQNLTLKQVEIRSRGKWKAVVVGSYERGVRALSLAKAIDLCSFYGVPITALFTESIDAAANQSSSALIFDLRKIRANLELPDRFTHQIYEVLHWIASSRDDWNGEVMTLRKADLDLLTIITRKQPAELHQALVHREFYLTKLNPA
jgi:transcriptional regulator with XRE-family HTH domain